MTRVIDFNENNSRFLYLVHVTYLYNKRKRLNYEIKNKLFIIFIITLLVWFLRIINVLQYDNKLAYPIVLVTMIALFSYITIYIQANIDDNYHCNIKSIIKI